MNKYLQLLRVKQWVKNVFVFLPLFFAGKFLDFGMFIQSCVAFLLFSLIASSIYIINDIQDLEADRLHPEKRNRPIASGRISKKTAFIVFGILLAFVVLGLCWFQKYQSLPVWKLAVIIGVYFVLNLAYSFHLKHVAIIDICIIAVGFVLRVFAGGYSTGLIISKWAILLTFILALVLAVGKRRGELVNVRIAGGTRKSLDGYNEPFVNIMLSITCALAIVCYLMFTVTPEVQNRFGQKIFYTVFFVIFAFFRYLQQTLVYNKTESPTKVVYKDRYIQATLILWFLSFLLLIYFK